MKWAVKNCRVYSKIKLVFFTKSKVWACWQVFLTTEAVSGILGAVWKRATRSKLELLAASASIFRGQPKDIATHGQDGLWLRVGTTGCRLAPITKRGTSPLLVGFNGAEGGNSVCVSRGLTLACRALHFAWIKPRVLDLHFRIQRDYGLMVYTYRKENS